MATSAVTNREKGGQIVYKRQEFMSLPVAFDIEEVREIKTGMDEDAKTYYDDMVKKGICTCSNTSAFCFWASASFFRRKYQLTSHATNTMSAVI